MGICVVLLFCGIRYHVQLLRNVFFRFRWIYNNSSKSRSWENSFYRSKQLKILKKISHYRHFPGYSEWIYDITRWNCTAKFMMFMTNDWNFHFYPLRQKVGRFYGYTRFSLVGKSVKRGRGNSDARGWGLPFPLSGNCCLRHPLNLVLKPRQGRIGWTSLTWPGA